MLNNLKFFLLSLPVLAVISGCQTTAPKPDNVTRIQIEDGSLTRLSKKAQVNLEIYSGSQLVEKAEFSGLNPLPYIHNPAVELNGADLRAEVSVSMGGEILLLGESTLAPAETNHLALKPQDSSSLTESYWQAVDIVGRGIPPTVKTTLALRENGRISGFAGCNQYRGRYNEAARFVEIGQFESTNNICANPVMYHENRYFRFLKTAEYYEIKENKLLLYTSEGETPIVFDRTERADVLLSLKNT